MEAGTSRFISISDSDRRVPAELGQETRRGGAEKTKQLKTTQKFLYSSALFMVFKLLEVLSTPVVKERLLFMLALVLPS